MAMSVEVEVEGFSKRIRRTRPEGNAADYFSGIPSNLLANVSGYLTPPSRCLMAVALAAPSASWRARVSPPRDYLAMIEFTLSPGGSPATEALDFGDVEKSLSVKMTDDDIRAVLACIDARHRLKALTLVGCRNVTGSGLEPLRNSKVLEQIDLSLVPKGKNPRIKPKPKLSWEPTIPILRSIVSAEGNSLKYVDLPAKLTTKRSSEQRQFEEEYHELLDSRGYSCSRCDNAIDTTKHWLYKAWIWGDACSLGYQRHTCGKCKEFFCHECQGKNDHFEFLRNCENCGNSHCQDCTPGGARCDACDRNYCGGCADMYECDACDECENYEVCRLCRYECVYCGEIKCDGCVDKGYKCDFPGCRKSVCNDCLGEDEYPYKVEFCQECTDNRRRELVEGYGLRVYKYNRQNELCQDHRISQCSKDLDSSCEECMKIVAPEIGSKLFGTLRKLHRENDGSREEIAELRAQLWICN